MFECPPYVKIGLFVLALAIIGAGVAAWHHATFEQGFVAGVNHQIELDTKALAHNQVVHDATKADITHIDVAASTAASAMQVQTVTLVKTVEKIVHENPDFAVLHRPPELERLRLEQIAHLRALAGPGAEPAAGGSAPE